MSSRDVRIVCPRPKWITSADKRMCRASCKKSDKSVTRQQRMGEQSRLSTWPDVNVLRTNPSIPTGAWCYSSTHSKIEQDIQAKFQVHSFALYQRQVHVVTPTLIYSQGPLLVSKVSNFTQNFTSWTQTCTCIIFRWWYRTGVNKSRTLGRHVY
jgi:hypothetical protein